MNNFDLQTALNQYMTHLRFLGYDAQVGGDEFVVAKHPVKPDILIFPFREGTVLRSLFRANSDAKRDRVGYLELINKANVQSLVVRYYADGDGDFIFDAFFAANYSQVEFSRFLELWDKDIQDLIELGNLTKYLA